MGESGLHLVLVCPPQIFVLIPKHPNKLSVWKRNTIFKKNSFLFVK